MGNGFWNKREASRIVFADKDTLLRYGTAFRIVAAACRDSNRADYGPQLVLTCETLEDGAYVIEDMPFIAGAKFNIGLGWNDARAAMRDDLNASLQDGEMIVARLYQFDAKGGKAYDIEPAPSF